MSPKRLLVNLLLGLSVLALSACDIFIPVPMPAPSSIPVKRPPATPTRTPRPTATPFPTHTATPAPYFTPTPPLCDRAELVAETLIPSATFIPPGTPITQTWRVRNDSTCTWTPGYWLVKAGGHDLGGPLSMRIPYLVFPGEELNLSVDLSAPCDAGIYYSYWKLRDEGGVEFGVGSARPSPLLVHIVVNGQPVRPACAGTHSLR